MGLPGVIRIKITTAFDEKANSASRTIQYLSGWGLNCLAACRLGNEEFWEINRSILVETAELPDGLYELDKQPIGPDWRWVPTEDTEK